jgi:hypothetical protein
VDYFGLDCGAVNCGKVTSVSTDHEIRYNTCYNSGRCLFVIRPLVRGYVHHNTLYRAMLRTTDGGAIYSYRHDAQNTEIAYNRIHDVMCGGNGGTGVYVDNDSLNFRIHHNLIYNTVNPLGYNLPCVNILWYNNTAAGVYTSLSGVYSGSQAGTEVRNNIFTKPIVTYSEMTVSNNILNTVDPQFVAPEALDFRLRATSPARDAGLPLSPYTNGYDGAAPDIGAFEYGVPPWTAGSSLNTGIAPAPTHLTATLNGNAIHLTWQNNTMPPPFMWSVPSGTWIRGRWWRSPGCRETPRASWMRQ